MAHSPRRPKWKTDDYYHTAWADAGGLILELLLQSEDLLYLTSLCHPLRGYRNSIDAWVSLYVY
jgi:hypothetical protein